MLDLSYPYWYLVFCGLLSATLSLGLYYFKKRNYSPTYSGLLAGLRFLTVFIIAFLLLKPVIKYVSTLYEKPVVLLGIDNSQSMAIRKDSTTFIAQFQERVEDLEQQLGDEITVETVLIGDQVSPQGAIDFSESVTNLSSFINYVNIQHQYSHLVSASLITDGIVNQGANPNYQDWNPSVGLNVVGTGDSSMRKDQQVVEIRANSIAYLGNKIPIRIDVAVEALAGETSTLIVSGFGKELYRSSTLLKESVYSDEIELLVDASSIGNQKISVQLVPIEGEWNTTNNYKEIYIKVKDRRQKVLMLYDFPHPDIAAVRSSLESRDAYEVELVSAKNFMELPVELLNNKYNVVLAYQIPGNSNETMQAFDKLNRAEVSVWFIGSSRTNYFRWFDKDPAITWSGNANESNTVQGKFNRSFSLFSLKEDLSVEQKLPPLKVPFGVISHSAGAHVLAYQQIGKVATDYPLWIFTMNENQSRKSYLFGEGIWRWKMTEFQRTGASKLFDDLVDKSIQFLAQKKDLSRFKVKTKSNYLENEAVIWDAEFFNLSYESINTPDVNVKISDLEGKSSEFILDKSVNSYTHNSGGFEAGVYKYTAQTEFEGKSFSASGSFTVSPLQLEYNSTRADFDFLSQLAGRNNGTFYTYDEWEKFVTDTKSSDPRAKSFEEIEIKDLIHQKWLFFLLVFLLGAEWVVRKREGVI